MPFRMPLGVLLSALLFMMLGATYSLVNPAYQSPDEIAHVDLVLSMQDLDEWPAVRERAIDRAVHQARNDTAWAKDAYRRAADEAPARSDRPTMDELDHRASEEINHVTQHPPLYYVTVATATSVVGIPLFAVVRATHDRLLSVQRLVNVLALAALPLLAAAAVRALGGDRFRQVAAAVAMLGVPQLLYIGSSVNNDNLLVLSLAGLTLGLSHVLAGRSTPARAVAVGAWAAVAMLSKVFGLLAPVWIALVYFVVWLREPRSRRMPVIRDAAVALAVSSFVGGAWWLRNLIVEGKLSPEGLVLEPAAREFDGSVVTWLRGYVPRIVGSFWGNFGYLDVPVPVVVVILATVIAIIAMAVASRRAVATGGWDRLVLLAPLAMLILGLAADNYLRAYPSLYGRFAGTQGRYWFGGVLPAVVFSALYLPRIRATAVRMILTAVLLIEAIGLVVLLQAFYSGGIPTLLAWSPWPVWVSMTVLLVTLATTASLVAAVVWDRPLGGAPLAAGVADAP